MWRTANEHRFKLPLHEGDSFLSPKCKHPIELVLYVDEDDKDTLNCYYSKIVALNTTLIIGKRPRILGETTNRCAKESTGEICMLCTDDVIFHTEGWDELVVEQFLNYKDRIVLVYGEDGIQHGRTATLPFLHINWINTIGRFLPTYFISEVGDRWLTEVATKIGRLCYLPNLYIQHLHPVHGTMPYDSTYTERRSMRAKEGSSAQWSTLYNMYNNVRQEEANKLLNYINEYKG
jgi:hypothetical protein